MSSLCMINWADWSRFGLMAERAIPSRELPTRKQMQMNSGWGGHLMLTTMPMWTWLLYASTAHGLVSETIQAAHVAFLSATGKPRYTLHEGAKLAVDLNPAPSSPWVFGVLEPDFRSFTPFNTGTGSSNDNLVDGCAQWSDGAGTAAAVGMRLAAGTSGGVSEGQVFLQPLLKPAAVRFVVPSSGLYDVAAEFGAGDTDTAVLLAVFARGRQLFSSATAHLHAHRCTSLQERRWILLPLPLQVHAAPLCLANCPGSHDGPTQAVRLRDIPPRARTCSRGQKPPPCALQARFCFALAHDGGVGCVQRNRQPAAYMSWVPVSDGGSGNEWVQVGPSGLYSRVWVLFVANGRGWLSCRWCSPGYASRAAGIPKQRGVYASIL